MDRLVKREILALIPARGGSKGLINKNLRPLGDRPLVAQSVLSALASSSVTRTIVSTDSRAVANAAIEYGAEVPLMRPAELAADGTRDFPVFRHALDWLWENERYKPEIVVQIRPTTPLRPRNLIDDAVAILRGDPAADSVRSVAVAKQTPYKMWKQAAGGYLQPLLQSKWVEPYNMPRQELPKVFWQTGHVDVIRTSTILEGRVGQRQGGLAEVAIRERQRLVQARAVKFLVPAAQ